MNLNQESQLEHKRSPQTNNEIFSERIELSEQNEEDEQQQQHKLRQSAVFLDENAQKSDDLMPSRGGISDSTASVRSTKENSEIFLSANFL